MNSGASNTVKSYSYLSCLSRDLWDIFRHGEKNKTIHKLHRTGLNLVTNSFWILKPNKTNMLIDTSTIGIY